MTEHVRRAPETDSSTVMFLKLHAPQGRTIPKCGNKEYILQLPERAVLKNSGCAIVKKKHILSHVACGLRHFRSTSQGRYRWAHKQ